MISHAAMLSGSAQKNRKSADNNIITDITLERLSKRLELLESNQIHQLNLNRQALSPSKKSSTDSFRLAQLEETVLSLQYQLSDANHKINELQQNHKKLSHDSKTLSKENYNHLKQKIVELQQNTTKVCRTLSIGLHDVQNISLGLYSWGDNVYNSFGKVTTHIGMNTNPCNKVPIISVDSLPSKQQSQQQQQQQPDNFMFNNNNSTFFNQNW